MTIGAVAALATDIQKLDKRVVWSAFLHCLLLSAAIASIRLPGLPWWLNGSLLAVLFTLPILILFLTIRKKTIPTLLATALILGLLVGALTHYFSPDESPSPAATFAVLKNQADQWDRDIVDKKETAIADNMSDDFRHISKNGAVTDKKGFLGDILSADLKIDPYQVEDLDIRIYGDCALLHGTTRMTGSYQGEPFTSNYRFTDTYIRGDGQWKVCQVQISSLPD